MTCSRCSTPEPSCGPLSEVGECLECEITAADVRDLETLRYLQEYGYEGAAIEPPLKPVGCPDCGGTESIVDDAMSGMKMCANCGRIE